MADFASQGASLRVAVIPAQDGVRGIGSLADADSTPAIEVVPLAEAFSRRWPCDAHFTCYLPVPFDAREPMFRFKKEILPEIRETGHDVHVHVMGIDIDTGDTKAEHLPWAQVPEKWGPFDALRRSTLAAATPLGEKLRSAAYSYSTRRGWRYVFVLKKPLSAEDSEPVVRGLITEMRAAGFLADLSCADWTRVFRLPRVLRDGISSETDPFFMIETEDPTRRLDASTITPVGKPERTVGPSGVHGSCPPDDEAEAHLWGFNEKNNNQVFTDFYKTMEKQLKGQPYHPYVFEYKVFDVSEGHRHDTIRNWTLSAAGHVVRVWRDATPQHLYALFLRIAAQVERADGRQDVWRLCTGAWNKVAAEWEQEQKDRFEEKKQEVVREVEGAERILDGLRRRHKDALPPETPRAWDWARKRMILKEKRAGRYHVMRPDGSWSSEPVDDGSLVPQILQLGMDAHIPVEREGRDGPRPVKTSELALEFVTNVSEVKYRCEIEGSYIENPENAESPTLVALSFRRNPRLTPQYSADCDLFLKALGGRLYDLLNRHLGCFLAWERGAVAAMSFANRAGSGKGMLFFALEEVLEFPKSATGEDLIQRFNSKLVFTPYIFLNEGLAEEKGAYHPSDMLRKTITGDVIQYERKGRDAENLAFPYRVALSANGMRLIDAIGAGRDLEPHEREAIGHRLIHYPEQEAAHRLLCEKGGDRWTKGWIKGKGGEPSKHILARHLLWLWEQHGKNAEPTGTGRLLIEGDPNQEAIQRLRLRGGSTPALIEAIVRLLSSRDPGFQTNGSHGVLIVGSRLYVTASAPLDYWRDKLTKGSRIQLDITRVRTGLKGLVVSNGAPPPGFAAAAPDGRYGKWHEIDVPLLASEAEKNGWSCERLERLMEAWRKERGYTNGASHTQSGRILALPGGA